MDPQRVIDFWFGEAGSPEHGTRRREWFRKCTIFDQNVRERFLTLYDDAAAGLLSAWGHAPRSLLALIIVLDQFPRNMFRNAPRAFATDSAALAAAVKMVDRGWDLQLAALERLFIYLPFEHAEDPAMQRRALQLFGQLAVDDPACADLLDWAQKHHDVIVRFGRFPHRNEILGRTSTAEEAQFLRGPGSRF
jgi:uncharacterized protein (DUF924 family)